MKLNWFEEIKRIDPDIKFRAQGGWLKTVDQYYYGGRVI